jgi:P27 family predicted phage terminase small subunit
VDVQLGVRLRSPLALDRGVVSARPRVAHEVETKMRGRKPKPTNQKILEGNPGRRPLNAEEPQLPAPTPDVFDAVPIELNADLVAATEWRRLAPMLRKARQITEAERGSLIALCQQWSRYLEAQQGAAAAGMVVLAPSGYPMVNPYIGIANKALAQCRQLWSELGLTPTSRTRVIALGAPRVDDEFAEFDEPPISGATH